MLQDPHPRERRRADAPLLSDLSQLGDRAFAQLHGQPTLDERPREANVDVLELLRVVLGTVRVPEGRRLRLVLELGQCAHLARLTLCHSSLTFPGSGGTFGVPNPSSPAP